MLKKSTFTEFLQIIEKKTFYYFFYSWSIQITNMRLFLSHYTEFKEMNRYM